METKSGRELGGSGLALLTLAALLGACAREAPRREAPRRAALDATPSAGDAGEVVLRGRVFLPFGEGAAGAALSVLDAGGAELALGASDGDGRFELPVEARGPLELVVRAAGFPVVRRQLLLADPTDELIVNLPGALAYVRLVVGGDVSLAGRLAEVWDEQDGAEPRLIASALTDADGRCALGGLPAGRELTLRLPGSTGRPHRFTPKEDGVVELMTVWGERGAARITGLLLDDEGAPVPGYEVWLRHGEPGEEPRRFGFLDASSRVLPVPGATCVTDAQGRFAFEGVGPGTHWIGPAATRWSPGGAATSLGMSEQQWRLYGWRLAGVEPSGPFLVPEPVVVDVRGREAPAEVVLRVRRLRLVRGRLEAAFPLPVGLDVTLKGYDTSFSSDVDHDGSFLLGPVTLGSYRLQVRGQGGCEYLGEYDVEVGQGDVVVPLRTSLLAVVRTSGVGLVELDVRSLRTDVPGRAALEHRVQGDRPCIRGLEPGVHTLVAECGGRWASARDVDLRDLGRTARALFDFVPAARVRVSNGGDRDARAALVLDGLEVASELVPAGESRVLAGPAGPLDVHLRGAGADASRAVVVRSGEELELSLP